MNHEENICQMCGDHSEASLFTVTDANGKQIETCDCILSDDMADSVMCLVDGYYLTYSIDDTHNKYKTTMSKLQRVSELREIVQWGLRNEFESTKSRLYREGVIEAAMSIRINGYCLTADFIQEMQDDL